MVPRKITDFQFTQLFLVARKRITASKICHTVTKTSSILSFFLFYFLSSVVSFLVPPTPNPLFPFENGIDLENLSNKIQFMPTLWCFPSSVPLTLFFLHCDESFPTGIRCLLLFPSLTVCTAATIAHSQSGYCCVTHLLNTALNLNPFPLRVDEADKFSSVFTMFYSHCLEYTPLLRRPYGVVILEVSGQNQHVTLCAFSFETASFNVSQARLKPMTFQPPPPEFWHH